MVSFMTTDDLQGKYIRLLSGVRNFLSDAAVADHLGDIRDAEFRNLIPHVLKDFPIEGTYPERRDFVSEALKLDEYDRPIYPWDALANFEDDLAGWVKR